MTDAQKCEEFFEELYHFLEGGGWAIKTTKSRGERVCRKIPALCINDKGLLAKDPSHAFDGDLLAEYWKFRCKETEERYDQLYNKVLQITKEF